VCRSRPANLDRAANLAANVAANLAPNLFWGCYGNPAGYRDS